MEQITSPEQYKEAIKGDGVTVIKYFADWCPDCKNLDRFLGDIVAEHPDKQWYEMDAELLQPIAEENEVRGIPSLLVYKDGKKIAHLHSKFAKTPAQIREYLDSLSAQPE
jgi:thiol-disulfide isomerase/thioredoxin